MFRFASVARVLRTCGAVLTLIAVSATIVRADALPVYKGEILLTTAIGKINRKTNLATLKVSEWILKLETGTNGCFPSTEDFVIAIGEGQGTWRLDAGMLTPSPSGTVWKYKAPKGTPGPRTIKTLRIKQRPDGTYALKFFLTGVDVSQLSIFSNVCEPFAVIIGDDDGFNGISLSSRTFNSKRLIVPKQACTPPGWPWA